MTTMNTSPQHTHTHITCGSIPQDCGGMSHHLLGVGNCEGRDQLPHEDWRRGHLKSHYLSHSVVQPFSWVELSWSLVWKHSTTNCMKHIRTE